MNNTNNIAPHNNDTKLTWELADVEHLAQDKYIDFRRAKYKLPDGKIGPDYYNYSRKDYSVIIAIDENGRFICVKQYRHGIGEVTTEFPAGGIEADSLSAYKKSGKSKEYLDKALDAAIRELREETGYVSEEWEHLITVPSNATLADNYGFIYLAKNCKKVTTQDLDEDEFLNVEFKSFEEIEELIKEGKFQQAIHILAWELYKNKYSKK